MWEPEPLTTLRASKACRGENFTFYRYNAENKGHRPQTERYFQKTLLVKKRTQPEMEYGHVRIKNLN
jgi:hypothetical protein